MPDMVLYNGDTIRISFAETDGDITVSFSDADGIKVFTEWPDTSGRSGVVYHEPWETTPQTDKIEVERAAPIKGDQARRNAMFMGIDPDDPDGLPCD